ncbi:MAG: LarC family nickel insertion protein [Tissierellia bacterium]|nr:LarC family nickel insertion protein [Tissierellia bacterium]
MTDQTLYLECNAGVSGDMTVAALIDLGADTKILLKGLESLNVEGYSVKISNTLKNGINAIDFNVILNGKECTTNQSFMERNIDDIYCIINNSSISEKAKKISKRIFYIVAEAESKAHKVPLNEVYFHESGAVDSIVDIVSAAICLDNLRIKNVIVEDIYDGHGFIKCRKGIIPVPVPAVVNIAEKYKLNIIETDVEGEMVTPTGASIIAAIRTKNTLPANYKVKKIGYGAGKRKYRNRGVFKAYIIE